MRSIVLAAAVLCLAGCADVAPPTYPWTSHEVALRAMNERDERLRTLSAECLLTLNSSQGTVRLDGALAMEKPNHLRLRAWKFSQPVFDLTMNDEGVFVVVPDEARQPDRALMMRANAGRIARAWGLFTGALFREGNVVVQDRRGPTFVLREPAGEDTVVLCTVDRATLTARQYEMLDADGMVRFTLKLDDYKRFGDVVFPTRITGEAKTGTFTADLSDVTVNQPPAPNAFVAPERAEKLR